MSDFRSLGVQFRQAREAKELSLQEVEKRTRIRPKFLQAIEDGNFFIIDNPTQLKGFLRTYARAVGLDDVVILSQYEAALRQEVKRSRKKGRKAQRLTTEETLPPLPGQMIHVEKPSINTATYPREPEVFRPEQSNMAKRIVGVILILSIIGLLVSGVWLTFGDFSGDEDPTPPPGVIQSVNIGGGSPVVLPTATPTPEQLPSVVSTPDIAPGTPLNIQITAQQRLWLQVEADGAIAYEGLMRPGDGLSYQPNEYVRLRTTNAGGLQILVNSQPYILGEGRVTAETTISVQNGISSASLRSNNNTPVALPTQAVAQNAASPTPSTMPTTAVVNSPTPRPSSTQTQALPAGVVMTSTSIPVFGFATDTPTFTASPVPPSMTPTFTASPFLPERATRTPAPNKN